MQQCFINILLWPYFTIRTKYEDSNKFSTLPNMSPGFVCMWWSFAYMATKFRIALHHIAANSRTSPTVLAHTSCETMLNQKRKFLGHILPPVWPAGVNELLAVVLARDKFKWYGKHTWSNHKHCTLNIYIYVCIIFAECFFMHLYICIYFCTHTKRSILSVSSDAKW